ncbi:MAG: hypothetical protein GF317_14095 [Candidatus Lokiarchaeota archaeon]|nr:hypothetical protein [Candidatus Lokiarchaeota archaeon]MBD3200747.1 hypothetical protein [Candidatus Lokiarchaeota archaeon]
MILLTYFNRTIGPELYLSVPQNLKQNLDSNYVAQIKSLLDTSNEGFFNHYFSPEFKTANWIFTIDSEWARGFKEVVMITIIIREEEPDFSYYERILGEFKEKIRKKSEIYKAFYINKKTQEGRNEIYEQYGRLKEELDRLYKIVSIKVVETEGSLVSLKQLKETKSIEISDQMLKKITNNTKNSENCFIVFRTRGKSTKIDILPVATDKILRLTIIFGEQMTVKIIQKISQIFSKYEETVSLVFTSGICQEIDRCLYEVYINADLDKLNEIIEEIYKIEGVLSIQVKLIETS